jgi:hypothetical protein
MIHMGREDGQDENTYLVKDIQHPNMFSISFCYCYLARALIAEYVLATLDSTK